MTQTLHHTCFKHSDCQSSLFIYHVRQIKIGDVGRTDSECKLLVVDRMYGTRNYATPCFVVPYWFFNLLIVTVVDDLWMMYDDLKSTTICQFKSPFPTIDPREVHIVMWQSRPAALNACSHSVPAVHSATVSVPAAGVVSVPLTAKVTTSSLPKSTSFAPVTTHHQLLASSEKSEEQLKQPLAVFDFWPPVIAGALRHKVLFAFYC